MIRSEAELEIAQACIRNLEEVLRIARQTYPPEDYRLMSEPFLQEVRERQAEVDAYLGRRNERQVAV